MRGITIRDTGGDGIIISPGTQTKLPCRDIIIKDCISERNRRNGLTISSVDGILVLNCLFQNNNGTKPAAGIDFEAHASTDVLANIVIRNVICRNNTGAGFNLYLRKLDRTSRDVSILIDNCLDEGNGWPYIRPASGIDEGPVGIITIRNVTIINDAKSYLSLYDRQLGPSRIRLIIENVKWGPVVF